jgi:SAM-dependent methyltransferase
MKPQALKFLVCPSCHSELELLAHAVEGPEVMEGQLSCSGCGKGYAVQRGVPRFVEIDSYAASFGSQWNWFRTVQLDSVNGTNETERTLEATTGWRAEDYQSRLVLDAGVGAGRFAEIVAKKGGEVVGIDLTTAVDAAYANIGRHDRVHLVQADVFAMPFRTEIFDLAYSIGVLHHTPDPCVAFERVAATVKPGGGLAVYLYAGYGPAHLPSNLIRQLTTRLPVKLMLALCTIAIPLYYVYRLPYLGTVLQLLCPISQNPNWRWRWLDTFDWYTPKYQWKLRYPEVIRWFRANGLSDLTVFDDPIRICGVKVGCRPVSQGVLENAP